MKLLRVVPMQLDKSIIHARRRTRDPTLQRLMLCNHGPVTLDELKSKKISCEKSHKMIAASFHALQIGEPYPLSYYQILQQS
jgi:hypothetical protein